MVKGGAAAAPTNVMLHATRVAAHGARMVRTVAVAVTQLPQIASRGVTKYIFVTDTI